MSESHLSFSHLQRIFICTASCLQLGYLYLIGYLYMQSLFALRLSLDAGMVFGLKAAANLWTENEEVELLI